MSELYTHLPIARSFSFLIKSNEKESTVCSDRQANPMGSMLGRNQGVGGVV